MFHDSMQFQYNVFDILSNLQEFYIILKFNVLTFQEHVERNNFFLPCKIIYTINMFYQLGIPCY